MDTIQQLALHLQLEWTYILNLKWLQGELDGTLYHPLCSEPKKDLPEKTWLYEQSNSLICIYLLFCQLVQSL